MANMALRFQSPLPEDVYRRDGKTCWKDDQICQGFSISKNCLNLVRASMERILERHQLLESNTLSLGRGQSNLVVVELGKEWPAFLANVPEEWGVAALNHLARKVNYNAKRRQKKLVLKEEKRRRRVHGNDLPKSKIEADDESTTKDSLASASTSNILGGVIIRVQREGERHCFSCRPKDLVAFGQTPKENLQIKDINWTTFHNILANTWHFNASVEDLEWSYADGILSWVGDEIALHAALEAILSDGKYPMFRIGGREPARMLGLSSSPLMDTAPQAMENAPIVRPTESIEVPHQDEPLPSRGAERWLRHKTPLDYTFSSSPELQQFSESEGFQDPDGPINYPEPEDEESLVFSLEHLRKRQFVCLECRRDDFTANGLLSHSRIVHNIIFKSQRHAALASEQSITRSGLHESGPIPGNRKTKIIVLKANPRETQAHTSTTTQAGKPTSTAKRKGIVSVEIPYRSPSCLDPIHKAKHHM